MRFKRIHSSCRNVQGVTCATCTPLCLTWSCHTAVVWMTATLDYAATYVWRLDRSISGCLAHHAPIAYCSSSPPLHRAYCLLPDPGHADGKIRSIPFLCTHFECGMSLPDQPRPPGSGIEQFVPLPPPSGFRASLSGETQGFCRGCLYPLASCRWNAQVSIICSRPSGIGRRVDVQQCSSHGQVSACTSCPAVRSARARRENHEYATWCILRTPGEQSKKCIL